MTVYPAKKQPGQQVQALVKVRIPKDLLLYQQEAHVQQESSIVTEKGLALEDGQQQKSATKKHATPSAIGSKVILDQTYRRYQTGYNVGLTHEASQACTFQPTGTDQAEELQTTQAEFRFEPQPKDVFPPRSSVYHPIDDYIQIGDEGNLPENSPYTWVPEQADQSEKVRLASGQIQTKKPTSLPLEYFDNFDLNSEEVEALLDKSKDEQGKIMAYSRYYNQHGQFHWARCEVESYDKASSLFCIKWIDSLVTKKVKRLNLLLDTDNRSIYRYRLNYARRMRKQIEQEYRFSQYVAEQEFNSIDILNHNMQQRLMNLTGFNLCYNQPDKYMELMTQVKEYYQFAVNQAIIEAKSTVPDGRAVLEAHDAMPVKIYNPAPETACIDLQSLPDGQYVQGDDNETISTSLPWLSVYDRALKVTETLPLANEYFMKLLAQIYQKLDVRNLVLINAEELELSGPTVQLDELMDVQRLLLSDHTEQLKSDWLLKILSMIEPVAFSVDQRQESHNDEVVSQLAPRRQTIAQFIKLIALTMTDQIHTVALNSVQAYCEFWATYDTTDGSLQNLAGLPDVVKQVQGTVRLSATEINEGDHPEDEENAVPDAASYYKKLSGEQALMWGADLYTPYPPPLLLMTLHVVETENGCTVQLQPTPEEVISEVTLTYDSILKSLEGIDEVSARLVHYQPDACIPVIPATHPTVANGRKQVEQILRKGLNNPQQLQQAYQQEFEQLLSLNSEQVLEEWSSQGGGTQVTQQKLQDYTKLMSRIENLSSTEVTFRMIRVQCGQAKDWLKCRAEEQKQALLGSCVNEWNKVNQQLVERMVDTKAALNKEPNTTEEMAELQSFVLQVEGQLESIIDQIDHSKETYELLGASKHAIEGEYASTYYGLRRWPASLANTIEDVHQRLQGYHKRYLAQLQADRATLNANIALLRTDVENFITLGELNQVDDRMTSVLDVEAQLQQMQDLALLYQSRQTVFGQEQAEYPTLDTIEANFAPYAALWRMCSEFSAALPEWMDGPFTDINAEQMGEDCDRWATQSAKLLKQVQGGPLDAIKQMRQRLDEFRVHLPIISALRSPGLRERHWAQISEAVGFPVRADEAFSVSRALQLKLPDYWEVIEEVAEYAGKEYSLEKGLDKMQGDWSGMLLEYSDWRDTGTFILKSLDEIQLLLDDQIMKTQSMRSSPYVGPLEERVRLWEAKLNLTQEILDNWITCQQGWLYLEPIFGSDDIQQQMPNEGRKFKAVDDTWRTVMERMTKNPEVLIVCSQEEVLGELQFSNKLLEEVHKGLNDYLDTKRTAFPRFYFLSNDELLEILSETKDPTRVGPFLKKIFEGIAGLEFQPSLEVTAMISEEGEKVPLEKSFQPKNAGGNVEVWLIECENAMRDTVKSVTKQSFEAFASGQRIDWVVQWPGQAVLAVDSMMWTKDVAVSIGQGSLSATAEKCNSELMEVVNKVRGKLTKLERKTLSALIVIDVHAKEVVAELAANGISSEQDFEWQSQLRYTWEDGEISVRMINAQIFYGYEYLGNSSRLVITPLTDRCYRTLLGAMHLSLGGAPEGPAGTGKTETTKDLAKAIAMQCVVFNCSDGLDYLAMGKFFKGLASSGAWACFDEFNRIDLEVLSVIAQQILTMQRAKAANLKQFEFEGSLISLRPTFSVFITMNPGYAGRSELPDNLKALFRSVAMMVPDYALIAEIMLYSSGYLKARDLARKLVATYKLCSEQLSSQSHYDYGMRAVMAVLRAAAANKQKSPDDVEDVLMLRSIKDVNAPKFLAPDIPLFEGILSDLFPGVELPASDYEALDQEIKEYCKQPEHNLQPTENFMSKAHQLYDMILVRHGLMVVGLSFGAKTSIYSALAAGLGALKEKGLQEENKVQIHVINPKSISMGQLYGQFDPVSHEWQDGVLARKFRSCSTDTSPDRQWLLLDGPVDAIWIENMNTVLDDNKKLCLNSGEIIAMSSEMSMIFEVADLAVASPATVSRCGMVYVEPQQIGWRVLKDSWLTKMGSKLDDACIQHLDTLMNWVVDPVIGFIRKNCVEMVQCQDMNIVQSMMKIYECLIHETFGPDASHKVDQSNKTAVLEAQFIWSVTWSLACTVTSEGVYKIDQFMKKLLTKQVDTSEDRTDFDLGPGLKLQVPDFDIATPADAPQEGQLSEYLFDLKEMKWVDWMDTVEKQTLSTELNFNEIVVQTKDTIRYQYILNLLIANGKNVLVTGPTGTGKTVYIQSCLNGLDKAKYRPIQTGYSAQTGANQVQDIIDSKLDKRRKGVFGPPLGLTALVFVDDVNMPAPEVYGAQPPVELLRQWLDHDGWYDRSDGTFRNLIDMQLVTAMGPPGGGRNNVTGRFSRHFNVIAINEFSELTYLTIYKSIIDWWHRRAKVSEEPVQLGPSLVQATLEVYNTIRSSLLPTPQKSHYLYNMRDISKVFQGIQMVKGPLQDKHQMVQLWAHEVLRVFHDRLVDDEDRQWFRNLLKEQVEKQMQLNFGEVFPPTEDDKLEPGDPDVLKSLIYSDFVSPTGQHSDNQAYCKVNDISSLLSVIQTFLDEYNATSKRQMNLVLFLYAAQHVCRISRILRQPLGHALLVGVGGSGRQSLTKVAALLAEYEVVTIEVTKNYGVNEWRDDLRSTLRKAGLNGEDTVFLLADTQIKQESFLEDINNILNTGEVPNLFGKDDLMAILENMTPKAKKAGKGVTPQEVQAYFVEVCRQHLHVVLAFSPVGDTFRAWLRKFPSLVNCCTIDWFQEWPSEALKSVAQKFLCSVDMDNEQVRESVEDMCMEFHTSVRGLAADMYKQLRRHSYATPTSYLELIQAYKNLLGSKRNEVQTLQKRYTVGLDKLLAAESDVHVMKEELIALQPQLVATSKEVEATLVVVDKETKEAEEKKAVVQGEEAIANEKAAAAQVIKDECEKDLAVAMPVLEAALSALNTLTKSDIVEVKAMKNPPVPVKTVMEAVCILLRISPKRVNDPSNPTKKINDYWGPSQNLLGEANFMQRLKDYDKDNIAPELVSAVTPYLDKPDFSPDTVKKASKAAYGLCCWVRAMESYDRVAKVVAPKREKLAASEAELGQLREALDAKKAQLSEVESRLESLNNQLNEMQAKKVQLEADVQMCEQKLDRATKLIGGLGGEKTRWTEVAAKLGKDYVNLTGDVLLASGFVAYLGVFTTVFREQAVEQWSARCREKSIPCSEKFSLMTVLGDPVKCRDWVIDGLPNDTFSIENAITITKGRRWPLLIDPQGQANSWIKSMESNNSLSVVKLTDGDYARRLENCISLGHPVLLENVGEHLDAALEPLLLKDTWKQGSTTYIKLGDQPIEYNPEFRFYITTSLRNPHYLPEVAVKVSLINFMITMDGLQDQILGKVVQKERPELEEEKAKLVVQGAENARQLAEIEDKIIQVLSSSEGNILEDETAINVISSSKTLSNEVTQKQAIAAKTEKKIDEARLEYTHVAKHIACLYFMIAELANIEPMYQYSLTWYGNLFEETIRKAEKSKTLSIRIKSLTDHFTFSLYTTVCRSLFEKDKLLFAFLVTVTLKCQLEGSIQNAHLRFLLTGGISAAQPPPNPTTWLSQKLWGELARLGEYEEYKELFAAFQEDPQLLKVLHDSSDPAAQQLDQPWNSVLAPFQRLLILRCIRPDKLVGGVRLYVQSQIGSKFVEPQQFDLATCYADSSPTTPLIFVLSPGSDPMADLLRFAEQNGVKVESISLGQGQGPKAEKLMQMSQEQGGWVVLQNCHLAVSWMPKLEQLVENFGSEGTLSPSFRLWLTSYPSDQFPVKILQNGVKMTQEAPKGLRANLLSSYNSDPLNDNEFFSSTDRPAEFKKLLFGLCFFHAVVQERREFGSLGWNVQYQFSTPDFLISVRQLQMFLSDVGYGPLPLQALTYLTGECNYGGRVTDAQDRKTLMALLGVYYTEQVLDDLYQFSSSGLYYIPQAVEHQGFVDYIKSLPPIQEPEVFGLNSNADITKDQREVDLMLASLLATAGSGGSSGESGESGTDVLLDLCTDITDRVPKPFDIEYAEYKYPVDYYQSMNTVLTQEMVRYNRLLVIVHKSLKELKKAIQGLVVMSADIEQVGIAMSAARVPALWMGKSYPSLKPLGSYVTDLVERCNMLQKWLDNGPPKAFWLSGFFFTHAFLTGVKQNYARKYHTPIDAVTFTQTFLPEDGHDNAPEDGAFVYGMYIDGARWDYDLMQLAESEPKILYTEAPWMQLAPCEPKDVRSFPHYSCPLYRTAERKGVLATTGHSTNFVMNITVPTDQDEEHWIRRGVAYLLQLSD